MILSLLCFSIVVGLYGNICVFQKKGLIGDVLGHSILPGLVLSLLLFNVKSYFLMLIFSILFSYLAMKTIDFLKFQKSLDVSNIIAAVLSGFFGLGVIFMSVLKKSAIYSSSGISSVFYGNISAISNFDISIILYFSILFLLIYLLFRNYFKFYTFDPNFFILTTKKEKLVNFLLNMILIFIVTLSVNIVGIILTTGLLIIPSLSSRNVSKSFFNQELFTVFCSFLPILIGIIISLNFNDIPTGPLIIVVSFVLFLFTYFYKRVLK